MLVRWFTEFLGGTKSQAWMLWSREESQTTRWDCSSRKNTLPRLPAQAQGFRERPPEHGIFASAHHEAGSRWVTPARFRLQSWLVTMSSRACTLAARDSETCGFSNFLPSGGWWPGLQCLPHVTHPFPKPQPWLHPTKTTWVAFVLITWRLGGYTVTLPCSSECWAPFTLLCFSDCSWYSQQWVG